MAKKKNIWDGLHTLSPIGVGNDFNDYYAFYLRKFQSITTASFEWKGLPDEIDERVLENILYFNGVGAFSHDDILGYVALWTSLAGTEYNIYMLPREFEAYGLNGYHTKLTEKDSVYLFDNNLLLPGNWSSRMYASRLADLEVSLNVNLLSQRFPIVIKTSEEQKLAMQNFMGAINKGQPAIFVSEGMNLGNIQSIDTKAPYIIDKLQQEKLYILGEFYESIGVNCNPYEKRERVQAAEVEANNDAVMLARNSRLLVRQQAAEKINQMYGLNVSVSWRFSEMQNPFDEIDEPEYNFGEEGEE